MIKYYKVMLVLSALFICLIMSKPALSAETIVEGMDQGEFAMLLIKELGAEGILPTAATISDAFALLEKLGIVPLEGWDEEADIDREDLIAMLGLSKKEAAKLSFDQLLEKLKKRLSDILWTMGVYPAVEKTISPAGGS